MTRAADSERAWVIDHGIRLMTTDNPPTAKLWNPKAASVTPDADPMEGIRAMISTLAGAVAAADLYLNSYDTSAPSRIKAETRLMVEEAMALIRPQSRTGLVATREEVQG